MSKPKKTIEAKIDQIMVPVKAPMPTPEAATRLESEVAQFVARQEKAKAEAEARAQQDEIPSTAVVNSVLKCKECEEDFPGQVLYCDNKEKSRTPFCAACIGRANAEASANRKAPVIVDGFAKRWERACPERYREPLSLNRLVQDVAVRHKREFKEGKVENDWTNELETVFRMKMTKVLDWELSERGIGIVGRSRRGKTRVIFKNLEGHCRENRSIEYVNLALWGTELSALAMESMVKLNKWLSRLRTADILFLDDLGKQKSTERAMTELYSVIEYRTSAKLPIDYTANAKGEALMRQMTVGESRQISDCAEPIIERIRDYCEGVSL